MTPMKRWLCGRLKGENCVKTQPQISDPFLLLLLGTHKGSFDEKLLHAHTNAHTHAAKLIR